MDATKPQDRFMQLQRRPEQLAKWVPPGGIKTEKLEQPDGSILFRFSHDELGPLGQLRITPMPASLALAGQCLIDVEIEASDPDTEPHWDERYRMLDTMVTLCTTALAVERTGSPL